MKAITCRKYGPPEVLKLEEVPRPEPKPNQIRIRVHATAANAADWRLRKPDPGAVRLFFGLFAPRKKIPGGTMAGVVDSVGANVTKYKVGDRVFGSTLMTFGAYAEYVCLPETAYITRMPDGLSFNDAAAIPFGGMTALHFLRKAKITPGQKVLVIGASGAVGTAAVQIAKHMGAEVTGVCSGANAALVKSLGASHVVDYTKEDFSKQGIRYDVVYETVSGASFAAKRAALKPGGALVLSDAGIGQTLRCLTARGIRGVAGVAKESCEVMEYLAGLVKSGALKPVIDRTYKLADMVAAHHHAESGHKKGNVVVEIN